MVLLSEGLPFLVVTIGFEKSIVLTKAVLSAALDTRRARPQDSPTVAAGGVPSTSIQYAVQVAIVGVQAELGVGFVHLVGPITREHTQRAVGEPHVIRTRRLVAGIPFVAQKPGSTVRGHAAGGTFGRITRAQAHE